MVAVDFKIIGLVEANARLTALPGGIRDKLRAFMAGAMITLRDMVKANILERFRSAGPLYKGVSAEMTEDADRITGRVFTTGAPYAHIQEYGGDTAAHDIYPKNGVALAFMAKSGGYTGGIGSDWRMGFSSGDTGNALIIRRFVHHPGSRIPERAYARPALFAYRVPFQNGIRAIVNEAIGN